PDLAADPSTLGDPEELKKEIEKQIKKFPEGLNTIAVEDIEAELGSLIETAGVVEEILQSGAGNDFMIQLEQFKNDQRAIEIQNPVLGLAVESLFDGNALVAPQTLDLIADSRALEPHYGSVFQNVEISSQLFSMLHPEYFR
ncbi:MAG: hypothetical protein R3A80_14090, partial [Bdellovibrionota bacterium]